MKTQLIRVIFLTLMTVSFTGVGFATDYTVSNDAELLEASLVVVNGDLVELLPGLYNMPGQFTAVITFVGTTGNPEDVVVSSAESWDPLFDVSGYGPESVLRLEGVTFQHAGGMTGGLVDAFSTAVEIRHCIFEGNSSYENGGAISARFCDVIIEDSTFRSNSVNIGSGGAVYVADGDLTISGCSFSENHSSQHGGAVGLERCNLTMADCSFVGNTAIHDGGGLDLYAVTGSVVDCLFDDNFGSISGGGLIVRGSSSVEISNCIITNNLSLVSGAGIEITGASYAALSYCLIGESAGVQDIDGAVQVYSSALFHCCEMDEDRWYFYGTVEFDNEGCIVATQTESFDSLKAMYR